MKTNRLKKWTMQQLKQAVLLIYRIFRFLFRVNKKIVLFESYLGRSYSGNPKYIYEKFVDQGFDRKYKCVWILDNPRTKIPGKCVKVKKYGIRYFYYMATGGFWVFDTRQSPHIVKRKGVTYIQTWHGTPLKKLALDMNVLNMAGETNLASYKKGFLKESSKWDYLVSQNYYSTDIFRRAFKFNKTILEIGYPRNDILVNRNNTESINALKKHLNLPLDKKAILYAPTWRDDEYYDVGRYKINLQLDMERLSEQLGKDYIILFKLHYMVKDDLDLSKYKGFAYDFCYYPDIQELYLVSDILITDYSSVMFDYSLLKRPIIFFTYDLDKYREQLRGFYFNLEDEAPGPIVMNTEELIDAIRSSEEDFCGRYKERYERFSQKYNHLDDGKAADAVVQIITK